MRKNHWITGIVLCLCGVLLVRLCSGNGAAWIFAAAGYFLSGGGLFWIALGVSRRIDADNKDS